MVWQDLGIHKFEWSNNIEFKKILAIYFMKQHCLKLMNIFFELKIFQHVYVFYWK